MAEVMRVVVDTNVLVSAALRDRLPEEVLLFILSRSDFEWIVTHEILQEYREVLERPKFRLPEQLLERWLLVLDRATHKVEIGDQDVRLPRDPTDERFLRCALGAGAQWLITGDGDFEEAERLVGTTIVSVRQFKRLVVDVFSQ